MQKTTAALSVFAMAALNASAMQLGVDAQALVAQTPLEQWKAFWSTKKADYTFGTQAGQYDKRCTATAERRWFYAQNFKCPAKDTEEKRQKCLTAQEKNYDDLMAICLNTEAQPATCSSHSTKEVSGLRINTFNRLKQHNKRRRKHVDTQNLDFDLNLACQALTHAKQAQSSGSLGSATGLDSASPPQGENIASREGVTLGWDGDWEETQWYDDQIGNYRYSDGTSTGGDIHAFTQMVYDDTTKLGCALVKFEQAGNQVQYSVCRYASPQNLEALADNVKCPKAGCPDEGDPPAELPTSCQALSITSGSDAYNNLIAYNNQRLEEHNEKRALHQDTDPLTFNLDLACQAQYWANEHALRANELNGIVATDPGDRLVHYSEVSESPLVPEQGENLAWRWRSPDLLEDDRWEEQGWYDDEIGNYNFATGTSNGGVIGHFTQMVWKTTSQLGCGIVTVDDSLEIQGSTYAGKSQYSVCRYWLPGNYSGQYTTNVGPLISS